MTTTDYLTPGETAARLKVSPTTVSRWTRSGRLTRYRLGGRVYFSLIQVESLASPRPDPVGK